MYFPFFPSPLLFPEAKRFFFLVVVVVFFNPQLTFLVRHKNVLTAEPHNPMWAREWPGGWEWKVHALTLCMTFNSMSN